MPENFPNPALRKSQSEGPFQESIIEQSRFLDERTRQILRDEAKQFDLTPQEMLEVTQMIWGKELKEKRININNQEVRILGAAHSPETLLFARKKIDEAISHAGAVILEGAPEVGGLFAPEFIGTLKEKLLARGESNAEAEEWIQRNIDGSRFVIFFEEMEQLVKKYEKPLVTIDPYSSPDKEADLLLEFIDGGSELEKKSDEIRRALLVGAGGAVSLGVGMLVSSEIEKIQAGEIEKLQKMKKDKGAGDKKREGKNFPDAGRRKFLGGLAALGVGAALSPTAILSTLDVSMSATGNQHPAVSTLLHNMDDYRNVSIAMGVERLTKMKKYDGPIVVIYGYAHVDPLATYLQAPKTRALKYAAYQPFRDINPPRLSEFRFTIPSQNKEGAWEQTIDEPL